jgi:hypothetical protein
LATVNKSAAPAAKNTRMVAMLQRWLAVAAVTARKMKGLTCFREFGRY